MTAPAAPVGSEELRQATRSIAGLTADNERLTRRFLEEESRASDLMKLLLTLRQLHEAPDRAALVAAIQDVVVNVIGSEQMAIHLAVPGTTRLSVASAMGLDAERRADLELAGGDDADVATRLVGALRHDVLACAPLMFGGALHGAIVIHGLLEHKPELDRFDHELLDLLSVHAGSALAFRMAA
jgi:hypothetical protein